MARLSPSNARPQRRPAPRSERLRMAPARPLERSPLGAALLLAAVAACGGGSVETMRVRAVHLELLFGDVPVETRGPEGAPPGLDVLTPSYYPSSDPALETGDMPALLLPAPGKAEFAVPDDRTGELTLRAWTGIDASVAAALPADAPVSVAFRVTVAGEVVHEETREVHGEGPGERRGAERAWRAIGGPSGLTVRPGEHVLLETEVVAGVAPGPLRLGFGGLYLEQYEERPRERATRERPNVLFVVMDTQRADRLGLHGHGRDTSPAVDALAARGTSYTQAYATSSWTWPSTASLLTGLRPEEHGVTSNRSCYLAGALETLPEALQRSGYTTAGISGNPLIVPRQNFDQGFEFFDHGNRFRKGDVLVPRAVEWLEEHGEHRFFLYVHLTDPHTPHLPRAQDLERFGAVEPEDFPRYDDPAAQDADGFEIYAKRLLNGEGRGPAGEPRPEEVVPEDHARWMHDCYDACVRTGDHWVGELLAAVERLGLAENTLIAFTSDHGEELLDRGLLAHGHTLHGELVRAPLVLAGPGVAAGVRSDVPVSNRHLAATLARVGGARLDNGSDFAQRDLRTPEALPLEAVSFSTEKGWWNGHKGQALHGIRTEHWILHHAPTGAPWGVDAPAEGGQTRLYRAADEGELADVAAEEPGVVETLLDVIAARRAAAEAVRPRAHLGAGAGLQGLLDGLGYTESSEPEASSEPEDR